jgi:hypothetical protein
VFNEHRSGENSMSLVAAPPQPVLTDLIPGSRVRNALLVLAGTGLLIVAGQITLPLWFTPVPLSLATFAVLLYRPVLQSARADLRRACVGMVVRVVRLHPRLHPRGGRRRCARTTSR